MGEMAGIHVRVVPVLWQALWHCCAPLGAVALLVSLPALGACGSVDVGLISFDNLIPGDANNPGVNLFNISNFTGDPLLAGFALPPDFPVLDFLTFSNSSLTLNSGGVSTVISLGDIGPGALSPTDPVQFPDTASFSSVVFTANLNQASFRVDGGGAFVAQSTAIVAQILPSSGASLAAGFDFAVITVDEATPSAPEPGSAYLLVAAAGALTRFVRMRFTLEA